MEALLICLEWPLSLTGVIGGLELAADWPLACFLFGVFGVFGFVIFESLLACRPCHPIPLILRPVVAVVLFSLTLLPLAVVGGEATTTARCASATPGAITTSSTTSSRRSTVTGKGPRVRGSRCWRVLGTEDVAGAAADVSGEGERVITTLGVSRGDSGGEPMQQKFNGEVWRRSRKVLNILLRWR